jgi:hypothetical protein
MKLRGIIAMVLSAVCGQAVDFVRDVRPLVKEYCVSCHNDEKAKGGVNLARFETPASLYRDPKLWETALRQVEERLMPPKGKTQPKPEERFRLTEGLQALLDDPDPVFVPVDPGRKVIHRLSRTEYNFTVRDLLGVDARPADEFPADGGGGGGFDNNADTLFVPPILLEKYLAAADAVLALAPADRLFVAQPVWYSRESGTALENLRWFVPRAWRRPVAPEELGRLLAVFETTRAGGADFGAALRAAYKAALVSPHFLFRIERDRDGGGPQRLGDFELASRLSYFLWSSMPDDALFEAARRGRLRDDAGLRAEVRRMLRDPKARALSEQFVGQWLGTRTLGQVAPPDPKRFPEFTPEVRAAMVAEPEEFFADLLVRDASVLELIDSDHTWVNADLARLYDLPPVAGTNFVRVSLPDRRRGGITGMAAVLTQTSYPRRTSPVLRGKWLLEEVLGTPPPPPPPLVATLPADDKKKDGLTFRQRLEEHRKNENCAACHARLDPLGFALENFDPIGRWRTHIDKEPVDASGQLVSGEKVDGPEALKTALMARRGLIVRHLAEKMLAYSLGRGIEYYDIPAVKQIVERLEQGRFGAGLLVEEVVLSLPFRHRRGADFAEPHMTAGP